MDVNVTTTCPYCKHNNTTRRVIKAINRFWPERFIVVCEFEEGGCGYPYYVETVVTVETKTLGIEGMQATYIKNGPN